MHMNLHDARSVADELLRQAKDMGKDLTPLQVVKLVYLCQGWMLAIYDRPMFRQNVEAWKYGPVIRDVYDSVKYFGNDPVTYVLNAPYEKFEEEEKDVMARVLVTYGHRHGLELSRLTHLPGSPWHQTYKNYMKGQIIPLEVIKDFYREKYAQR